MFWRDAAKYGPSLLLVVSFLALGESHWIDRTLGAQRLFGGALALGALAGLLVSPVLLRYAMRGERWLERLCHVVVVSVASGVFLVFAAGVANRVFAPATPTTEATYRVITKGHSGRGATPFVVLDTQFGKEKFDVSSILWKEAAGELRVITLPGNLGFDRVQRFEVPRKPDPSAGRALVGEAHESASLSPSAPSRSAQVER